MSRRYWVVGGEYDGPDFRSLIPGTEKMVGPFEDEARARTEWTRLSCCPHATATTRYGIAEEAVH